MKNITKRNCVSAIEEILEQSIKVLDHGFIRVIDYMGDDASVVQAARVSYGKGTKKVSQDRGLIRYLMRNRHMTPFEMCEIKFHIKLPIFIARQWIRHRTSSVNEYSARYSILSKEFYLPSKDILSSQSKTNKQGRAQEKIPDELADDYLGIFKDNAEICYANYRAMLNEDDKGDAISTEKVGVARELARINLSLNYYTEWYWKVNLRNLLHFLSLRADSHAQYEIREYAHKILDIVKLWVPYSFEAFNDYVLNAAVLSQQGLHVIRKMIKGEPITADDSQLSKGEFEELTKLILGD